MGICGSSPAVKQNAEPALGQNGLTAVTPQNDGSQQQLHAAPESYPEVPAQEPTVSDMPPLTTVVSDQHTATPRRCDLH